MAANDRARKAERTGNIGRRGELRKLLVAAADSARRGRGAAAQASAHGASVRDRVLGLFRNLEGSEQRLAS